MEYEEEIMTSVSDSNISQLPVQDILWILHAEKTILEDSEEETALILCVQDERGLQLTSAVFESMLSLEFSSIFYLLSEAMLHPLKGKSRKPRCLTCNTPDLFQRLKSGHSKLDEICLPIFYSSDIVVPARSQTSLFYQCSTCHIRATPDYFQTCNQCKSVRYCSQKCQLIDWSGQVPGDPKSSHQEWCLKMQTYQEVTDTLADLPFNYNKETTSQDFTPKKYQEFLVLYGVYNIGVWRYECPSKQFSVWEYGELTEVDFPFVLVEERELGCLSGLKQLQHAHQTEIGDIANWFSYYKWRSFSLDSPIAILLTYPLTLFYIITSCLQLHYPNFGIELPKQLVVHVIGAEKEADMFHYFKELTCLLPSYLLEIHLYGKKVSRKANGWKKLADNMSFQLHRGHWHNFSGETPHFVIGFNAGLGAYKSWTETLKRLHKENIAAYFTEFCQHSHDWSAMSLKKLKSGIRLTTPIINPFRSPVRMFSDENCLPSYSNAFLSHLEYENIDILNNC
ncbi:zinc finger MYND domain-containing protein 15 isoform X1 [Octopus bimaculoides]|uniref:MYND-type domain-containing protein n=1 Tax=Octopus bimaculoides TaxID=37653 RepID=A0A0L8I029_OCTBM|nr:zinc finger MYND domain-containing protein 15 isoform X1 [Octopus bimaculoides]XP_014767909.1 zinc finger MYND domain-containing protein 15 isoform X1 [Octopus bimaculoides]XP_052828102.1 zinc finger MYND domain-containing protein 15 isoform X1 [Octopus bimaculoides]XP_052828103.1 zinc finger MYND domain-containing protein 15 isoform X1 [Octopus bimaculoides]|eukprot:XP_014767908.1 PREDICTED: zinc finger MYND domain-containing protein 15-like isoform X1 [Octopus bimaculoides]